MYIGKGERNEILWGKTDFEIFHKKIIINNNNKNNNLCERACIFFFKEVRNY